MTNKTITVPDIGGAEGAEVVEVLVAVGDRVELEQSLIVLESDKASMEIPASEAGEVVEIRVAVGDQLSEGDAVVVVKAAGAASEAEEPQAQSTPASQSTAAAPQQEPMASDQQATQSATASESAAATTIMVVPVPDIGTDGDVDLVEIAVEPGQRVEEGDSLVVLESDKASMEVPSPASGTVVKLLVEAGIAVREGVALLELEVSARQSTAQTDAQAVVADASSAPVSESTPETVAAAESTAPAAKPSAAAVVSDVASDASGVYAGPAVRKLAREFGVPLAQVTGSGPRGRVLKEDLHAFVKKALSQPPAATSSGAGIPPIPEVDFAKFGATDPQPRSRLDKLTADNMSRAWLNVPHVTQFDDADITDLEVFRASLKAEAERRGTKITPMPFLLKACAVALNANPKLKASLADGGETLVYKHYCHIGMAVDTPNGLVVPVIRDVDQKSIWELSEEVIELAGLARDKKLKPAQMQGGVFSISSLGGIGGRGFTPIVNAPEVAILGVSKASTQPVWDGSQFVPRTMLPLSLSYDHRVINGGDAGRFLTQLVELLSDIRRMVM